MTDVSLEVLNERAAISAVHDAAAGLGVEGEELLDSREFYGKVTALDPGSPTYRRQVRDLVAAAAAQHGARQDPPAPQVPAGPRQWTMDDVDRSSPAELVEAMAAGLLVDLGYSPRRHRGARR